MLLKWQGDYTAAKPLLEQALAIDKEALGEKHPSYATSLNNLRRCSRGTGVCRRQASRGQALAIRQQVLGARPRHRRNPEQPGGAAPSRGDYTGAEARS